MRGVATCDPTGPDDEGEPNHEKNVLYSCPDGVPSAERFSGIRSGHEHEFLRHQRGSGRWRRRPGRTAWGRQALPGTGRGRRRRGAITKTGNSHARRTLVESSWSYRFPARKTAHLQRRAKQTSEAVQAIAWKAQKRLCGRYQHLMERGKLKVQVCVAVARELAGFIWAIACEVMGRPVAVR